jgi:hypothetical protein
VKWFRFVSQTYIFSKSRLAAVFTCGPRARSFRKCRRRLGFEFHGTKCNTVGLMLLETAGCAAGENLQLHEQTGSGRLSYLVN